VSVGGLIQHTLMIIYKSGNHPSSILTRGSSILHVICNTSSSLLIHSLTSPFMLYNKPLPFYYFSKFIIRLLQPCCPSIVARDGNYSSRESDLGYLTGGRAQTASCLILATYNELQQQINYTMLKNAFGKYTELWKFSK
jgi:hypothetical protein